MRINHNISAMNTHRLLGINNTTGAKTLEKLSSGKRINRAGDDAAGMAISEKMRAQVRGLAVASRNALDGISLVQTAEGAMSEVHDMLQRMRELSVQAANGTSVTGDRDAIQSEIQELTEEIERISKATEYNTRPLLNGKVSGLALQVGSNKGQNFKITIGNLGVSGLSIGVGSSVVSGSSISSLNVRTQSGASIAITLYNNAILRVSEERSRLGAVQNRLEHTIKNLDNSGENLTAAMSRIEDTDMASEMSEFQRINVLQQAGVSMLAQANQMPQSVLKLLG